MPMHIYIKDNPCIVDKKNLVNLFDNYVDFLNMFITSILYEPTRRMLFLKINTYSFTSFNPKLSLLVVRGNEFTIFLHLPIQVLYTKSGKEWPSAYCEKDDYARRTSDAERRKTIAIV